MALLAFFFVAVFRSFDDKNDLDNEGDENKETFSKWSNDDSVKHTKNISETVRFYKVWLNFFNLNLYLSSFIVTYKEIWIFCASIIWQKRYGNSQIEAHEGWKMQTDFESNSSQ